MKTYIVSLPDSTRRQICKSRLISKGYVPIFFDAIDGRTKSKEDFNDKFDYDYFEAEFGFYPSSGEVGCALSHQSVYAELVESKLTDNYFLIVEDDCIPRVSAKVMLRVIEALDNFVPDIVLVGYSKVDDKIYRQIEISNPLKVLASVKGSVRKIGKKYTETTCGAVAYLVSGSFLKKLATIKKPGILADDWTFYRDKMKAQIFHVSPLCFLEDFRSLESNLEDSRGIKFLERRVRLRLPKVIRPYWRYLLGLGRKFLMIISWR